MSDEIERMAERSFRESIALGRIEQRIAEEKRMSDETQPLLVDDDPRPNYSQAWQEMKKQLGQAFMQGYQGVQQHKHGPFIFLLNQNHNALRGCTTCGAAWVGLMVGHIENHVETLCWHPVAE